MWMIYLSASWLVGIWTASLLSLPWEGAAVVSLSALGLGLVWRHRPVFILTGACLAAVLLGQVRYQTALPSQGPASLSFYNGTKDLEIQGWVSAEPDIRDRTINLRLDASRAKVDGVWRQVEGTALAVVPRYPRHQYGEELRLVGKLDAPELRDGFDYPSYLARQDIYSVMAFPQVQVLRSGGGLAPWGWLLGLKERLAANLAGVLPEPQAALAQGILLGLRASIPRDLLEAFNRSGTTHIIVISGHNLTLLAGYLLRAGQPLLGRRRALWLSLVAVGLYTLLVGAQPPVVRAAVMAAIFILGAYLGRQRQATIALALAAAAMAALQPLLLWDVSFQLSFAATAGLVWVAPAFQERLQSLWLSTDAEPRSTIVQVKGYLIENLSVTAAATIAVLPLLLINFQRLPLLALPANLLLLPALPGVMLAGALAATLGFLGPLGQAAGWAAWPFLTYMETTVGWLGGLPLASLDVPGFQSSLALAYYSLLGLALLWRPAAKVLAP